MIEPERLGHVIIPPHCKAFAFHREFVIFTMMMQRQVPTIKSAGHHDLDTSAVH